jgi:FkbM family methyltransferase
MSVFDRIRFAVSKLLFCFSSTVDVASFIKLVINTKKGKWLKGSSLNENPDFYNVLINNKKREVFLRTGAGDIDIFYEVFWKKVYDLKTSATFNCIIDLGANIGLSAIYFSTIFKEALIISVEPDPDNYNLLLKNCEGDIRAKKIAPLHAAVYSRNTELYLNKSRNAYNSTVSEVGDQHNYVQGISIEKLCFDYGIKKIDLLKIDIEGAEEVLFETDYEWLRLVDKIIIELHSDNAKENFINAVVKYGFTVDEIKGKGCQITIATKTNERYLFNSFNK